MIVGDRLVLDRRGAALVQTALEVAMTTAQRNGVRYRGGDHWDDVAWLHAQAPTVAAGSAAGTVGHRFEVVMPSSAPVPELLTSRQAAAILRISPRAVVKRIEAGQLPARRVGREWLITEYDARHAAGNGRADAEADAGQAAPDDDHGPAGRPARRRRHRVGQDPAVAAELLARPGHGGRPGRKCPRHHGAAVSEPRPGSHPHRPPFSRPRSALTWEEKAR